MARGARGRWSRHASNKDPGAAASAPSLCTQLHRHRHILDQSSPHAACDRARQRVGAVCQSQSAVLAVGYAGTSATFEVTRQPGSRRPHLLSANLAHDTMAELDAINGTLDITFNGNPYDANINLAGVTSFLAAAHTIQVQVNAHLSVLAATTASSITPETTSFTGSINGGTLTVTSITSGSIERGGLVSGPKDSADQIERQMSGTPGGVGTYGLFAGAGHDVSSEAMTETYGMLTVGSVTSGNVALGELVTGAGVALNTLIITNLSGSGAGSTWVVDNSQTVAAENLNLRETPLAVELNWEGLPIIGATEDNDYFDVTASPYADFDYNPSTLSYVSGTAATALGLTQASDAILSPQGGQELTVAEAMNELVKGGAQFSSYQNIDELTSPIYDASLEAWETSQLGAGHDFSSLTGRTNPAGSSLPTTDPAGTYSGPGASAPTPAAAGTYIPVTGATSTAAEIVDHVGSYSLAGADAPTLAQASQLVGSQWEGGF